MLLVVEVLNRSQYIKPLNPTFCPSEQFVLIKLVLFINFRHLLSSTSGKLFYEVVLSIKRRIGGPLRFLPDRILDQLLTLLPLVLSQRIPGELRVLGGSNLIPLIEMFRIGRRAMLPLTFATLHKMTLTFFYGYQYSTYIFI